MCRFGVCFIVLLASLTGSQGLFTTANRNNYFNSNDHILRDLPQEGELFDGDCCGGGDPNYLEVCTTYLNSSYTVNVYCAFFNKGNVITPTYCVSYQRAYSFVTIENQSNTCLFIFNFIPHPGLDLFD